MIKFAARCTTYTVVRRPHLTCLVSSVLIAMYWRWRRRSSLSKYLNSRINVPMGCVHERVELLDAIDAERRVMHFSIWSSVLNLTDTLASVAQHGVGLVKLGRKYPKLIMRTLCYHGLHSLYTSAKKLLCFAAGSELGLSSIGICHPDLTTAVSENGPFSHEMVRICLRVLKGEHVRVFFPLQISSAERNYTPVTRDNMDVIERVEENGGKTYHPIPDYRNGMKFNFVTIDGCTYHIHLMFNSRRDGDYLVFSYDKFEYGLGTVPLPTGLHLRFNDGYQTVYARGYSLDGKLLISVCTGAYVSTIVTATDLALARLRSGKKLNANSTSIQYVPNTALVDYSFQKDGNNMNTQNLTHLVALVSSGGSVDIFEILNPGFVNHHWPTDGLMSPGDRSEPSTPKSKASDAIKDQNVDGLVSEEPHHPSIEEKIKLALPKADKTDFPAGCSLTGQDGNISRVVLGKTLPTEGKVKGVQMAPPLTTRPITVVGTTPEENRITSEVRVEPYVNAGPEPRSKRARYVQRCAIKAIEMLFGNCKGVGSILDPEEALAESKPAVKEAVRQDANPFVSCDQKGFIKSDVIKADSAGRAIIMTHATIRVLDATIVKGLVQACTNSFFYKYVYGFKDADETHRQMKRLHSIAKAGNYPILDIDVEKLDASLTWVTRWIELYLAKYLIAEKYHPTIEREFERIYSHQPHMKGVNLYMGECRRSGEGGTSLFNTAIGAIIMMTYLLEAFNGDVKAARSHMGICGGDDASVPCVTTPEAYREVAAKFGLKLTIDVRKPDTPSQFLAIWYDPATGIFYPDCTRYLMKGFANNHTSIPDKTVIRRRSSALVDYWGDNIPLLSSMAKAVSRLVEETEVNEHDETILSQLTGYRYQSLGDSKLPTVSNTAEETRVANHYAEILGISVEKLIHLSNRYDSAKSFEDFPHEEIDNGKLGNTKLPYDVVWRALVLKGTGNEVTHSSARDSKSASKNKKANAKETKNTKKSTRATNK